MSGMDETGLVLMDGPTVTGMGGFVFPTRMDGMTRNTLSVPNKFRLAFTDKPAARKAIARIRDWPCQQLVVAHGPVVRENAQAVRDGAFAWLG